MILLVAVSYFGSVDVADFLPSLQASRFTNWRLILVDNSCSPEESERLRALLGSESRAELIGPSINLGYFGGARMAISGVPIVDYDWVCVLNTDLLVAPDALELLAADDFVDIGVIAPAIIDLRTGRDQNPYLLEPPSFMQVVRRRIMMTSRSTAQVATLLKALKDRIIATHRPLANGAPVYAPHGSVLLLSRSYFDRGGNLDHPMFLYGEENHVAEECRRINLPIRYRPEIRFSHSSHGQIGLRRSRRVLDSMVAAARYEFRMRRWA